MDTETIDRAAEIAALGLTVEARFIPFSQSRNKSEKSPSLNWSITIKRNGRDVLTCDYSAGMAHCPSYNRKAPAAWDRHPRNWQPMACAWECENGLTLGPWHTWSGFRGDKAKPILPDPLDVLYSLNSDADVLNYGTFEGWAASFGYDDNSRSAEATYKACLEIALKLRAAVGNAGLENLNTIFQDY